MTWRLSLSRSRGRPACRRGGSGRGRPGGLWPEAGGVRGAERGLRGLFHDVPRSTGVQRVPRKRAVLGPEGKHALYS